MAIPMRFLAFHLLSFQLSPHQAPLFADGFLAASSSPMMVEYRSIMPKKSTLPLLLSEEGDDFSYSSPIQPADDIDANELLSQAYKSLTVKQLRELLRQNNAKVSGNKRELVDRLGDILDPSQQRATTSTQSNNEPHNGGKRKLLESYDHMTLKELKDLLRQYGAKISGNKRELVQRLMNLRYNNSLDRSQALSQHESLIDTEDEESSWSILEPSISFVRYSNATTTEDSEKKTTKRTEDDTIELPCLSGLIMVCKPSGYSTLPTKQQLDNPSCPTNYPCLSDKVKKWLYNTPDGQQRLNQAIEDEKRWWDFTLKTLSKGDPKQQKKLKKRRDKQRAKMETFEPRPVHRLDIDTSGIVCIALTPYALRAANMLFERKSVGSFEDNQVIESEDYSTESNDGEMVQKRYVALVEGTLGNMNNEVAASGVVKHPIGKVWIEDHNEWACDISIDGKHVAFIRPGDQRVNATVLVPNTSREAITSYRAVEQLSSIHTTERSGAINNNVTTRVELTPHTGRGHQLRLHMASIGHSIVGDDMHGMFSQCSNPTPAGIHGGRLCLHAAKLSIDAWCLGTPDGRSDEFQICRVDVESCPPF